MSANSRHVGAEHLAQALAAALRTLPVAIGQEVQHLFEVSSLPSRGKRRRAMLSSKSRIQALRPATAFSCRIRSTSSESWCGRKARTSRTRAGIARAPAAFSFFCDDALSSRRLISRVKKSSLGRDVGDPLLDGLVEAADLRIGHVAGIDELGVADDAAQHLLHRLITSTAWPAPRRRSGELALEALASSLEFRRRPGEVAVDAGRLGALIEVAQVPLRKRTEIRAGGVVHERFPVLGWQDDFGQSMRLARI